jgi:hypothetical protein
MLVVVGGEILHMYNTSGAQWGANKPPYTPLWKIVMKMITINGNLSEIYILPCLRYVDIQAMLVH